MSYFVKRPPWYSEKSDLTEMKLTLFTQELLFPTHCKASEAARDFISKLLDKDKNSRLGSGQDKHLEIMQHPFLADVDWLSLKKVRLCHLFHLRYLMI